MQQEQLIFVFRMTFETAVKKPAQGLTTSKKWQRPWPAVGLMLLALLFTVILSTFFINKHNAFNTRTYDFARFSQAIWNVLHGRFLFTTIDYQSILGNHFSPYMALLAPLLLLWPDERVLLVAQVLSVAAAGLFLALILYRRHQRLALLFLLAFYLNPAVHTLTLFEFRRVVLVMPFLALALLALDRHKKWLMLAALILALSGKEDIGLFVVGVGLFLLLARRDWWWGLGLIILGLGWSVIVSLWVIPAFREPGSEYPQLYYFDYLGGSYAEIVATLKSDPFILPRQLFNIGRLSAIGRILLPLGLFLPFLAPGWLLIALPPFALLLLSGDAEIYGLLKWYPTTILPVLFAAAAVGIARFSPTRARLLTVWLLLATLLGYWLFSPLPGGRSYQAELYQITDHDRQAQTLIKMVPSDAAVATFPHYVPHLTLRENVYHYPWIRIGQDNIDYFLFDCASDCYPLTKDEYAAELSEYLTDPNYALVAQSDDIYLFKKGNTIKPTFAIDHTAEQAFHLLGYDLLENTAEGLFQELADTPLVIEAPRQLKVILYWEAIASTGNERTISIRMIDKDGSLVAQHDGLPGDGRKPTSWWQKGQLIRDIHTLDIAADISPGTYDLELLLYDTFTQERVAFSAENEIISLGQIVIQAGR